MRKLFLSFLVFVVLISCSKEKETNMIVQGQIKGLKKGKLYLQKMKDTLLVSVDSIQLLGSDSFMLKDNIDSPEVYYLTFDANTTDKSILFFGEKGTITINDNVAQFGLNPEISGSTNQEILDKFMKIRQKLQNDRLELIKKEFEARKNNDKEALEKITKDFQNLLKRKVLFTTNFAIANSNSEVAPYLGLIEMYDASLKMLDTVNKSLTADIKKSKYGKRFQEYVEELKKAEKKE